VKQAQLTAKRLGSIPAVALYCSDLKRAIETAEVISSELNGVPYQKTRRLRECFLPHPLSENVPEERIQAGEKQASTAFSRYLRPARQDRHEIIVTHGNMIRSLVSRVLGGSPDLWLRMRTLNCGITEVAVESDGRMWLVSYNDVGHLPADLITEGVPGRAYTASAGR
jgi:probable phosphoglycerate mutase